MPWLTIIRGGKKTGRFDLDADLEFSATPFLSVGSDPGNDFRLGDEGVESFHGILSVEDGLFTYTDQGSRSGTFLNGEKIDEADLENGDRIILGSVELVFQTGEPVPTSAGRMLALVAAAVVVIGGLAAGGLWYLRSGDRHAVDEHASGAELVTAPTPEEATSAATEASPPSAPDPMPETEPEQLAVAQPIEPPATVDPGAPVVEPPLAEDAPAPSVGESAASAPSAPPAPDPVSESVVSAQPATPPAMMAIPTPSPVTSPVAVPSVPDLSGPAKLYPVWELGREYRYHQEETKITESAAGIETLKVIADATVSIEERSIGFRKSTGESYSKLLPYADISWQRLLIDHVSGGKKQVFDSSVPDGGSADTLTIFGRSVMSRSRGTPMDAPTGRPFFVRSESSKTGSSGDSWWETSTESRSTSTSAPSKLAFFPPLAWRLPIDAEMAKGSRWSSKVLVNLHATLLGDTVLDVSYLFVEYQGPLAFVRLSGGVDPTSMRSGMSLISSDIEGSIRVDVQRRVITDYDATIRVQASTADSSTVKLEQRLVNRLMDSGNDSPNDPATIDMTSSPENATPTPLLTPPPAPVVPEIAEVKERLLRYQQARADQVSILAENFRKAIEREHDKAARAGLDGEAEAARASLAEIGAWSASVAEGAAQAEALPLPALAVMDENTPPALLSMRKIFSTEVARIDAELGASLQLSLGLLVEKMPSERSQDIFATLAYIQALRANHPNVYCIEEN